MPQVAAVLQKSPRLVEVRDAQRVADDAIEIHVDRVRATFEGMDPDAVTRHVATRVWGSVTGQIQTGGKMDTAADQPSTPINTPRIPPLQLDEGERQWSYFRTRSEHASPYCCRCATECVPTVRSPQ